MVHLRALVAPLALGAVLATVAACGDGDEAEPTATRPGATATEVASAPPGAATFTVIAGSTEGAFDIEQFMPTTIRIREGDTIVWKVQGYEGHTVTFFPSGRTDIGADGYLVPAPDEPGALEFNPVFTLSSEAQGSYDGTEYVNSGFLGVPAPEEYGLTFPKKGVYPFLCMIHPLHMRGVVIVDDADAEVPSPETVAAEGGRLHQRYVEEAREASQTVQEERRAIVQEAAAGRVWQISAGIDTPHSQVLAFVPASLEIEAGDSVIFWNSDRDIHNVIFVPEGRDPPAFAILKPGERGGTRLLIDPESAEEVPPPPDFGPDAFFSSGLMGVFWPRMYYEVTFAKPGTYRYFCTVHTLAGMAGVVEVRARAGG